MRPLERQGSAHRLRITTILVTMVVGTVAIILLCCILLFSTATERHGPERPHEQLPGRLSGLEHRGQLSPGHGPGHGARRAVRLRELGKRDWLLAAF